MLSPDMALTPAKIDRQLTVDSAIALLSTGGDKRIALDPEAGLNRYHSSPYPRDVLAYASSTANDIGADAFEVVVDRIIDGIGDYAASLEDLRLRIGAALGLETPCDVVFAASGTDLEYVPLAGAISFGAAGICNILLGADEVGSGCIHSARGCHFADQTPQGAACESGISLAGLENVSLVDVPVRCPSGQVRSSAEIEAEISRHIADAAASGCHAVVHLVHGSKTGLILPDLAALDRLISRWAGAASFVVDACQLRIASEMVETYLARGAIVMLTGSKFVGGPPFSGFALVPPVWKTRADALPTGLARVFGRAEWPADWPGADILPDSDNHGLLMRLEASVFELERFMALPLERVTRVIDRFCTAVEAEIVRPLDFEIIAPCEPGQSGEARDHELEMRTLITIDVSVLPAARTFDEAQRLHSILAIAGIRLGQPVKCRKLADGQWAGTLRIGLSMPQVVRLGGLDDAALAATLASDMGRIAAALRAA